MNRTDQWYKDQLLMTANRRKKNDIETENSSVDNQEDIIVIPDDSVMDKEQSTPVESFEDFLPMQDSYEEQLIDEYYISQPRICSVCTFVTAYHTIDSRCAMCGNFFTS